MKIISFEGPPAVGKSSVIKGIVDKTRFNIIATREFGEKEKKIQQQRNFNLNTKEDFIKNQIFFFRGEMTRWQKIQKYNCDGIILDRGPEDTICFSYIHPRVINANWNIDSIIPRLKKKYVLRESDIVIYLYAEESILLKRKTNDFSRQRLIFDKLLQYYHFEINFYSKLENTIFINTTELSLFDVIQACEQVVIKAMEN